MIKYNSGVLGLNKGLLLGFFSDIGEFFAAWFDNIPKIIYMLFTAFSSAIDAMQSLVRKLAGLDTYYSATTGEAFTRRDPLSEFIFGILGIGNSSSSYKALNTVFWSLSIFGLIMLVVCTMVAMIKSHYSEDYAGTNPWKFIYTAIKAVLTYAVIPIVMVLGLQLSSFILRTLDNITSSTAGEEEIRSVYGANANEIFVGEIMTGTDDKSYIYYDFFGEGQPTNNTPFGSFLFKAAAYSCNRVRAGLDSSYEQARTITVSGNQIFGDSNCQAYSSLTSSSDKQEYVAYQIDYAFCNNLHVNGSLSIGALDTAFPDVVYNSTADVFGSSSSAIHSFSKYNVSAVWFFYDLWRFNFIVAFGGGVTIFGVLLSIIVGLMTRLIKGAALFLIYPSILGLAPLDNFKAFKNWGSTLLQQILMAFGAIVGMNILLLILPYLQNIAFFKIGIIDSIISMVLLIVGLTMTKDFISMVAGFAGGADANTVGGGLKSEVAGTIKKGASITGKLTGATVSGGVAITKGAVSGGIKIGKAISHKRKAHAIDKLESGKMRKVGALALTDTIDNAVKAAKTGKSTSNTNLKAAAAAKKAINKAKASGINDQTKLDSIGREAAKESLKNQAGFIKDKKGNTKSLYESLKNQEEGFVKSLDKDRAKEVKKYKRAQNYQDQVASGKLQLKRNDDGTYATHGFKRNIGKAFAIPTLGFAKNIAGIGKKIAKEFNSISVGKTMAKSFMGVLGGLGQATGADKLVGGLKDVLKGSFTFVKKNEEPKLEGDKLHADIGKKQREEMAKQTAVLKQILESQKDLKQAQTKNTEELKKFTSKPQSNSNPTSSNKNNNRSNP